MIFRGQHFTPFTVHTILKKCIFNLKGFGNLKVKDFPRKA